MGFNSRDRQVNGMRQSTLRIAVDDNIKGFRWLSMKMSHFLSGFVCLYRLNLRRFFRVEGDLFWPGPIPNTA